MLTVLLYADVVVWAFAAIVWLSVWLEVPRRLGEAQVRRQRRRP